MRMHTEMLLKNNFRSILRKKTIPSLARYLSVNPSEQGKHVILPTHIRQVEQPVSFGETISFNLHDLWGKLPNVMVNKHAILGDVYDAYYTKYKYRKIYGVLAFAAFSFWLLHVK